MDNVQLQIVELKDEKAFKYVCELVGSENKSGNKGNGNFLYGRFRSLCRNLETYEKIKVNAKDAYAVLLKYTFPSQLKEGWVKANIMDQLRVRFRFKKVKSRVILEHVNTQSVPGCTEYYVALVPVSPDGVISIDPFFNESNTKEAFIDAYIKFITNAPTNAYVNQRPDNNRSGNRSAEPVKTDNVNRDSKNENGQQRRPDFKDHRPDQQKQRFDQKRNENSNNRNSDIRQNAGTQNPGNQQGQGPKTQEPSNKINPGDSQKPQKVNAQNVNNQPKPQTQEAPKAPEGQKDIVIVKDKEDIPEGQTSTRPVSSATEGIADFEDSADKTQEPIAQETPANIGKSEAKKHEDQAGISPVSKPQGESGSVPKQKPVSPVSPSPIENKPQGKVPDQSKQNDAAQVQDLQCKLADRDSIIRDLRKRVNDLQVKIMEKPADRPDQNSTPLVQDLRRTIAKKESVIHELEEKLSIAQNSVSENISNQNGALLQDVQKKLAERESIVRDLRKELDNTQEKCHTLEAQCVLTKASLTDYEELRQKYGTPKEIEKRIYKSFLFDKAIQSAQESHDAETIRNILGYLKVGKEYCISHNIKILGENNE